MSSDYIQTVLFGNDKNDNEDVTDFFTVENPELFL